MTNMQEIRKSKAMTQEDLATLIGVSRVTIARYEAGAVRPGTDTATKIACALGLTIEQLWEMFYAPRKTG